jgi:hypothetical protein
MISRITSVLVGLVITSIKLSSTLPEESACPPRANPKGRTIQKTRRDNKAFFILIDMLLLKV